MTAIPGEMGFSCEKVPGILSRKLVLARSPRNLYLRCRLSPYQVTYSPPAVGCYAHDEWSVACKLRCVVSAEGGGVSASMSHAGDAAESTGEAGNHLNEEQELEVEGSGIEYPGKCEEGG